MKLNSIIVFCPAENDAEANINGGMVLGYVKNIIDDFTIDIDIFVGEDNLLRLMVKHRDHNKRKSDEAYFLSTDEAIESLTLNAVQKATQILEDANIHAAEIIEAAQNKANQPINTEV